MYARSPAFWQAKFWRRLVPEKSPATAWPGHHAPELERCKFRNGERGRPGCGSARPAPGALPEPDGIDPVQARPPRSARA
jgi:hypothetical protein